LFGDLFEGNDMSKYIRVMDGLKSKANGQLFEINKEIIADKWNPSKQNPEDMGGFNFSTEDKILGFIFRGDTIYDVIIPNDAEVILVDRNKGIYRTNKIIVVNPRIITEDMIIDYYKKSTLVMDGYQQYMYISCLLSKKYLKAFKCILKDIINKDNVDIIINRFEKQYCRRKNIDIDVFDYNKIVPEDKEIFDILLGIKKELV